MNFEVHVIESHVIRGSSVDRDSLLEVSSVMMFSASASGKHGIVCK